MILDLSTLKEIHLQGYISAIEENVGSIMLSGHTWNGLSVSENSTLVKDLLSDELGFDGVLLATSGYAVTVFNQGTNMYMTNYPFATFLYNMIDLVDRDVIKEEKINESVRKILRIKFELGLFENPYANRSLTSSIGSDSHRQIARQCVRESMVLLTNHDNILPLSKDLSGIHVAGKNADNIGGQCGGWTITRQGSNGPITTGTSILEAIKETVADTSRVNYSVDCMEAEGAEVGIVVIGERPYALEGGYRDDLTLEDEYVPGTH